MTAYVVTEVSEIHDPEAFAAYREATAPLLQKWGGRFLARVAPARALEGEWQRVALTEFPDWKAAEGFYSSSEYQALADARRTAAEMRMLLIGSPDEHT